MFVALCVRVVLRHTGELNQILLVGHVPGRFSLDKTRTTFTRQIRNKVGVVHTFGRDVTLGETIIVGRGNVAFCPGPCTTTFWVVNGRVGLTVRLLCKVFRYFFVRVTYIHGLVFFPFMVVHTTRGPTTVNFGLGGVGTTSIGCRVVGLHTLTVGLGTGVNRRRVVQVGTLFCGVHNMFFTISTYSFFQQFGGATTLQFTTLHGRGRGYGGGERGYNGGGVFRLVGSI